ncbi:MAG: NAD(P)H-binding protein [Acidimicrobiia bacterium]|nr:NAD(P)H-binding protein [Acidimicrobiia bacterium]
MRVLITGGSGELGIRLSRLLAERGHVATVASRSARPMRDVAAVEMDLATGAGVESLAGHDTVVHLASNPFEAQRVDVEGTQRLVDAAAAAGVDHLLAVSIVGVDDHPYPYYRAKAEMERIVQKGDVPWTILRATQFHSLVPRFVDMLPAVGFVPVPRGVSLQPIDVAVVAERLAELVEAGPSGRVADLGGPEIVPLRKMVEDVLGAKRLRRLIVPLPLPGGLGTALRDGRMLSTPTQRGQRWSDHEAGINPARDRVGRLSAPATKPSRSAAWPTSSRSGSRSSNALAPSRTMRSPSARKTEMGTRALPAVDGQATTS